MEIKNRMVEQEAGEWRILPKRTVGDWVEEVILGLQNT